MNEEGKMMKNELNPLEQLEKRYQDLRSQRRYSHQSYEREFSLLEQKILYTASFESRQEAEKLAAELARYQRIEAGARGLVEYRKQAGAINFQLEKADYFINALRIETESR